MLVDAGGAVVFECVGAGAGFLVCVGAGAGLVDAGVVSGVVSGVVAGVVAVSGVVAWLFGDVLRAGLVVVLPVVLADALAVGDA
jgi:hypothetical protein